LRLHDTSNNDTGKLSIDDAIMDYFSKKGITDQTEKLALARISSKMEISTEQVQMSINRLSAKNLIRKVYLQGRVGFELTPKGKMAVEVLAKAETARITRQLQEAIHHGRKAKLRSGNVNKMKSIEDEWQNYQMPDIKLIGEIEQEATKFLAATKEIQDKQPLCHLDPQNYDQEFSQYKPQIENLTEQNNNLTQAVTNYAKIKNYLLSISADIENINKTINKYEPIAEATAQVSQLKTSLCRLKSIQSQLENFDKAQLSQFEELRTQLADNSRLLEILKKPTHEFTPIKRETLAEKTTRYPDPECPINSDRKTSGSPLVEKCNKCGIKRRSTPVDIG
jgi:DNA-binding MarR family transcriptional regulator